MVLISIDAQTSNHDKQLTKEILIFCKTTTLTLEHSSIKCVIYISHSSANQDRIPH